MPEEILNIDYHTRRLLIRALNEKPSKVKASVALGVSEKSLYRMIQRFNVVKGRDGKYYFKMGDIDKDNTAIRQADGLKPIIN